MSFTYTQLKQAIQDYTENDETTFVTNLPIFIRNAEERILKSIQLDFFRKNVTGAFTASNKYLACPSDFLAPFSLRYTGADGDDVFLDFKDVDFLSEFAPDDSVTGAPRYYAVFDVDNFIVAPTPSTTFSVELHYLYRPNSLTAGADSGTTWLSTNAPLAMLYGSLSEAYLFMKGEPDILAQYDKSLQSAVAGVKLLGEAKETTQEYRVGRVRRPKQ
jgi:hypothetical protein|tara:strand:+ start:1560 stop:2210 length:651 start_codon:yes stop_codon:yes gene_type:complete